jgi:GxxExxY protein
MSLIYEDECYTIRGAIFEVYKELGSGFLESVYQECLEREFKTQNIPFISQPDLRLYYKGEILSHIFKPDFICFDKIIIELKSVRELTPDHKAQVINYLKATKMKLGFLVNFGAYPKVEIERIVL